MQRRVLAGLGGAWLLLIALIAVCAPMGSVAWASNTKSVSWPLYTLGRSGENVRAIQYLLKDQGYGVDVDGNYSQETADAVKRLQHKEGLSENGLVGALTWPKLIKATSSGSHGYTVMALQRQLNQAGSHLSVDGVFGSDTEKAVRAYQQQVGLSVDGVAGVRTWQYLLAATAAGEKKNGPGRLHIGTTTPPAHNSSPATSPTNLSSNSSAHGIFGLDQAPSVDPGFIDSVLAYYNSPARGMGQTIYDDGVRYGIDPAFALAFFGHESTYGLYGVAPVTHSLGNIRCSAGYACEQTQGNGSFRKYNSWAEGIEDWYRLMRETYLDQGQLYTVAQIIPVYAPQADHNNERLYIQFIQDNVLAWRNGQILP